MTTTTLPSTAELDAELNQMVLDGRILDAFDRFYADDIVMQENAATPVAGKQANREREEQFVASIEQFHGATLLGAAASADHSYAEWILDVTLKGGIRLKLEQVAARRWRDGLIVHERFYYNPTTA